ncbi:hypothetical protein BD309DRAFT_35781 [Dichomitus squalens]|uniref:Uncharacterized protein n=1 Tax=Dichomitus squalens TaxID=114155 RepID=A0A4Q9PXK6_9APHY|nr:hypothetical protein BD309DRAFT_35781 [Dichomitus squalens]TBU59246.1 hypothetical protein BD310DRAFT_426525 [Dichomitus squalens]
MGIVARSSMVFHAFANPSYRPREQRQLWSRRQSSALARSISHSEFVTLGTTIATTSPWPPELPSPRQQRHRRCSSPPSQQPHYHRKLVRRTPTRSQTGRPPDARTSL